MWGLCAARVMARGVDVLALARLGGALSTLARSGVAIASSLMLLGACSSTPALDMADVGNIITKGLVDQAGGTFKVTCPTEAPAQKGVVFTCSVVDETDGTNHTVLVTLVDDSGAFTWKVDDPDTADPSPAPSGSAN